jgi:hypothetical protein
MGGQTNNTLLLYNDTLFTQISQTEMKEFRSKALFCPAAQLFLGQSGL